MNRLLLILLSISTIFFFQSCEDNDCTTEYTFQSWTPVYKSAEELVPTVEYVASRELESPGKIYYYGKYILINEKNQGVHIIDNSDITNPQKVGFIAIEGNLDMGLKGDYLYADDYYNLLVIDISDITAPEIVSTVPGLKDEYLYFDEARGEYIVDYSLIEETREFSCEDEVPFEITDDAGNVLYNVDVWRVFEVDDLLVADAAGAPGGGGGGSLARLAFVRDHFYYVNQQSLKVFDTQDLANPDLLNTVYLPWGVETMFPYKDKLFIGANDGMHIMDNRDPANPIHISTFQHARACDPVVVSDDIAYVTLRDGSECQNFINQLDVVDVSNIREPELIASFPMEHPHGLSVREETLYLCEGEHGLKIFDVSNIEEIHENLLAHNDQLHAYDVISLSSELLLMVGDDGFYQIDVSDPGSPSLLSAIRIGE